jgi:hypothetical protein
MGRLLRGSSRVAFLALFVPSLVGCDTNLVTGYQPRRLGDSPAERKAYYASRFTPAAQEAQQERAQEFNSRRPNIGTNY